MRFRLFIGASAVSALFSCSFNDAPQQIMLERSACFGICPSYRLTVRADGTMRYEGVGWVNTMAGQPAPAIRVDSTRLSNERVLAVFAAFDHAWSRWRPNQFGWGDATCPSPATDNPTVRIVRARGAQQDTLELYYGCPTQPERITRAADAIDSLVEVRKWLGPGPRRRPAT